MLAPEFTSFRPCPQKCPKKLLRLCHPRSEQLGKTKYFRSSTSKKPYIFRFFIFFPVVLHIPRFFLLPNGELTACKNTKVVGLSSPKSFAFFACATPLTPCLPVSRQQAGPDGENRPARKMQRRGSKFTFQNPLHFCLRHPSNSLPAGVPAAGRPKWGEPATRKMQRRYAQHL